MEQCACLFVVRTSSAGLACLAYGSMGTLKSCFGKDLLVFPEMPSHLLCLSVLCVDTVQYSIQGSICGATSGCCLPAPVGICNMSACTCTR